MFCEFGFACSLSLAVPHASMLLGQLRSAWEVFCLHAFLLGMLHLLGGPDTALKLIRRQHCLGGRSLANRSENTDFERLPAPPVKPTQNQSRLENPREENRAEQPLDDSTCSHDSRGSSQRCFAVLAETSLTRTASQEEESPSCCAVEEAFQEAKKEPDDEAVDALGFRRRLRGKASPFLESGDSALLAAAASHEARPCFQSPWMELRPKETAAEEASSELALHEERAEAAGAPLIAAPPLEGFQRLVATARAPWQEEAAAAAAVQSAFEKASLSNAAPTAFPSEAWEDGALLAPQSLSPGLVAPDRTNGCPPNNNNPTLSPAAPETRLGAGAFGSSSNPENDATFSRRAGGGREEPRDLTRGGQLLAASALWMAKCRERLSAKPKRRGDGGTKEAYEEGQQRSGGAETFPEAAAESYPRVASRLEKPSSLAVSQGQASPQLGERRRSLAGVFGQRASREDAAPAESLRLASEAETPWQPRPPQLLRRNAAGSAGSTGGFSKTQRGLANSKRRLLTVSVLKPGPRRLQQRPPSIAAPDGTSLPSSSPKPGPGGSLGSGSSFVSRLHAELRSAAVVCALRGREGESSSPRKPSPLNFSRPARPRPSPRRDVAVGRASPDAAERAGQTRPPEPEVPSRTCFHQPSPSPRALPKGVSGAGSLCTPEANKALKAIEVEGAATSARLEAAARAAAEALEAARLAKARAAAKAARAAEAASQARVCAELASRKGQASPAEVGGGRLVRRASSAVCEASGQRKTPRRSLWPSPSAKREETEEGEEAERRRVWFVPPLCCFACKSRRRSFSAVRQGQGGAGCKLEAIAESARV